MREKCIKVLSSIFAVVFTCCLIFALLAGIGFLAAFVIGGKAAVILSAFLNLKMLPAIYMCGASMALVGVIKMYLSGEKLFFLDLKRKK